MDKIDQLLTRGMVNIIPSIDNLKKVLESGKKLNIYLGIDPTATKIHLGHAVSLRKLQKFADLGHNVTFLIGDFTALIGDTSDKESERPALTKVEIQQNFKTYKKQAEKILDFTKIKVKYNSEWLSKLPFEETIKLCMQFGFGDFGSRELIRKRIAENKHVGLHEALYPVMQGYDSYMLKTDVQIGGADQIFNMQAGRTLIKHFDNRESFVLSTDYLLGTDGRKMSKTWGNAIWLDDNPNDMYAKVMAINDDLIMQYFTLATDVTHAELKEIQTVLQKRENPINIKKQLAHQIVQEIYSETEAKNAAENFGSTVQDGQLPQDIPTITVENEMPLVDVAVKFELAASRSDFKRLVEQNGVRLNSEIVSDIDTPVQDNDLLEIGKRRAVRIKVK